MRQVTGSMANVVKGMDQAMKAMDLEKVRCQEAEQLISGLSLHICTTLGSRRGPPTTRHSACAAT